uniref:Candidate secreted effector n=1 Tax=Meloidogyne incognita TaxID=6306 RepID=A0A914NI32_MELIC
MKKNSSKDTFLIIYIEGEKRVQGCHAVNPLFRPKIRSEKKLARNPKLDTTPPPT